MQPASDDALAGGRITRVILEHAARISKEQDISALIGLHAALARDLVSGDRSSIWLIDEKTDELWTRVAEGIAETRIPRATGLAGACIAANEIIIANDLRNEPRFHRQVDRASGYETHSVLCVPLHADEKVIGVLQVLNKPGGFTPQDAELLGLMAVYAASAIQTEMLRNEAEVARLLRHELNIARDVQQRLLPQSFSPVPQIEYSGFCRSARFVGGDYYDVLPLGNGAFAFTLGDVSGKGIPAAVLMASIQTLLRTLLRRNSDDLAQAVSELNETVHTSSSDDRFSTLFCGVVNPERSEMGYVNAGQVPPWIVRDGTIQRPHAAQLPVGIIPQVAYSKRVMPLSPGDLVVCVSDGVTESQNRQHEIWDEKVIDGVLQEHRDAPVEHIIHAVVDAADAWAGGAEQYDDMTVVALRIGGA